MQIVLFMIFFGWMGYLFVQRRMMLAKELGRFSDAPADFFSELAEQFNVLLSILGSQNNKKKKNNSYLTAKSQQDMDKKLHAAGIESASDRGRFVLLRILSSILGPAFGVLTYTVIPAYYATLITLTTSAVGILVPMMWLKVRITMRTEAIQRELPLLLDLVMLGTSAGWDVAASLERVVDTLSVEFPDHPLIGEFKKARWLTVSGYTWEEALDRIGKKLNNDSVKRATIALSQAMKQGGDRSKQLQGIAEDAQRTYYADVDKRLAKLPVKVLGITFVLMLAYFMLLMAPAVVALKNIVVH